jgi:hypothetical protein
MSKLLLITRSHEFEVRLKELLGAEVATVLGALITLGAETVLSEIGKKKPSIVVVGPNVSFDATREIVAGVRERYPHLRVALVHEVKKEVGRWNDELGADVAIGTAATDQELLALVEKLSEAEVAEISAPADGSARRVIAVIAPKGGLGKTTIATNLAAGLARTVKDAVVLVDADVQFGDVATVLGLTPAHTLPDMVTGFAPRDTMVLKTLLTPHPAGFYVVGGAESPEDGDRVSGDQLVHLIEQLSDIFPYVIVDTSPGLGEHALSARLMRSCCAAWEFPIFERSERNSLCSTDWASSPSRRTLFSIWRTRRVVSIAVMPRQRSAVRSTSRFHDPTPCRFQRTAAYLSSRTARGTRHPDRS